ncbi:MULTISPECIES: MATE family efflux transporter [Clostridium]|uniref:Probable multidrug resistance protein NorM n=1 Tax=Clostridium cadaveris TaxID=1529 RepID=A0A1I2J0Y9_9CLOT|nr:MATE family efflux transporter [Clostridium cadaveris]MDU4953737.1 MATE family efflux transporter [Clostridium sp.]MDY4950537.1 MATE family efflux transporter [Clostridium cadaveris]NME63293.1 MATE family efflux transporter [Clostridium cadaveris]UFH63578.1 MATE family efflux transporter [Clostridium cadaveris]SFF48392.1 putative efflux protein, MATE family [Clostridium cadaveris]
MDTKVRRNLILNGDIYKVIITLSIPIIINNLIQTLYNLADGMYVSEISSTHFAATAFVWPVNFLFISIGIGLSIAGTSILSQFVGASKYEECSKYTSQIVAISAIASIIFSILGFFLTPFMVKAMGATGDLAKYSIEYLRITFLDLPFMFLFNNFNSVMVAQGNTATPTALSAVSAIINIVLDPIFIFVFDLGIAGAAWATLLAKAFLTVAGYFVLKKSSKNLIKLNFKNFKFNKEILSKIIKIALPSSIGQSGSALGFMILNGFIASYGNATMAAFGMVNRITSLIMQPASGVGAALTSVVGQNLGYNQPNRVKESFTKAMKLTLSFSILGCIVLIWKNEAIINFFMRSKDDMEVINQGMTYLKYISVSMPLMGMFSIFQGIFQGSGHTKYSMNMEIGRLWFVRLPMILLFKYITDIGSVGIWFSMSFSNLIICIYGYMVYRGGKWKQRIVKV